MACPSRLLLLDEHTAALDPKTAAFVLELTDQIVNANGLTTLMVTHSMRQALDHGERTIMLHQGRIVLMFQVTSANAWTSTSSPCSSGHGENC